MSEHIDYLRSGELISRHDSRLLVIDVQEKLLPAIPDAGGLIGRIDRLIQGAQLWQVPLFCTEQYPQGLGPTTPLLAAKLPPPLIKTRFSSAEVLGWPGAGEDPQHRHQVIMVGIEAHVCVLQTALDLLAQGYQVFIPVDAIASRHELDFRIAQRRLETAGAVLVTSESVLFEWCEVSGTPEFKQTSRLVKDASGLRSS